MKLGKSILLCLLIIFPLLVEAQIKGSRGGIGGFSTSKRHREYAEIIAGIGASNFLGEVGGANQAGTNFLKDLDFAATRISAQLAFRYHFETHWAIKGGFYYNMLSGSDANTEEPYRNNRNLSFRTNVFEVAAQVEFFFLKGGQPVKRYKIKGTRGSTGFNLQAYTFIGVGAAYFNPKAEYEGKWVALQPLGTEGQGLEGGPDKYKKVTLIIPFGLGIQHPINEWNAGIEIGIRKTYTDYLDDVSHVYFDNEVIAAERGEMAAYLADPKLYPIPIEYGGDDEFAAKHANQGGPGQQRGDLRDMDTYMFVNLTVGYRFTVRRKAFKRKGSNFKKFTKKKRRKRRRF